MDQLIGTYYPPRSAACIEEISFAYYFLEHLNGNPSFNVKIQYATLSEYFDAVFKEEVTFPYYEGDFFPYADNSDSYWTVRLPPPPNNPKNQYCLAYEQVIFRNRAITQLGQR